MRTLLKQLGRGERHTFQATFERFGERRGYLGFPQRTLLFRNIIHKQTGEVVSDHLWFKDGKQFSKLQLINGCSVEFDARVGMYEKDYRRRLAEEKGEAYSSIDYQLKPVNENKKPSRIFNFHIIHIDE